MISVFKPFKVFNPFSVTYSVLFGSSLAYQALLDLNPVLLIPSINDARAEGRLWQDAAMTIPATAADDPVGAVEDFSGNGYHLVQGSSTARPLLKQDVGGSWHLDFDGLNDVLTNAATTFAQPFTTVIAVRVDVTNGALFSAIGYFVQQVLAAFADKVDSFAGSHMADGTPLSMGTTYVISTVWDGASSTGRLDGASNMTGNVGVDGGGQFYLGADSGVATFLDGGVYGIAIYPSALSLEDIATVESYMASQSGVTL